jgi:hypothetical protein
MQVSMVSRFRAVLVTLGAFGVAQARPVIVENLGSFGTPDNAYTGFAVDVAIDGNYAIVSAARAEPDPSDPGRNRDFLTAFLFQRSGTQWNVVRRLAENEDDPDFQIPIALAMQNGIAAVQTVRTGIYELGPAGWTLAPSQLTRDGPGRDLEIDNGRILSGDGTCGWNGLIAEKDIAGTWRTSATLVGHTRSDGCDDEFRGGPVDISGDWAVVHQPDAEDQSFPETLIYRFSGGRWDLYSTARPEGDGATTFGPEVAIRGTDVIVGGSNESGSYVYRETPFFGFHVAHRFQSLDSFMGAGRAGGFAKSAEFLLQRSFSYDRDAGVVNVFRQRADETYEHVATLVGKNGASLGSAIAISGRSVLVGNNGNGLVHYFELPANLVPPALIQDTFATGNGTGWTPSAGSQFASVQSGNSRVYRQSALAVEARAVLAASDFTSQSIEADIRPTQFAASGSGFGLATRVQNAQNFYDVVVRNSGVVQLRRMAGGGLRTLASTAFTPVVNRSYRLRLESVGTLHRVYLDGRLLLDVDSTGPTHGRAALLTDRAAADFDNVVVSPSPTATIYANDFEGGSAGPWTHGGLGFWNLWTGASTVYNQSSIAGDARASIGVPADDQSVRLRTRLDTFANPTGSQERWFGVMARHVDERNYYYLSLRSSNTVSLRKLVNGSISTLASAPFTVSPATWYALRLDAIGDQLRAYVNGTLLLEATDASHPRGTSGPITFKAAADFDDFLAYQP